MKNRVETVLVIVVGFVVLFLLTRIKLFVNLAALVGVISLISDSAADKISLSWGKLSESIGYVMSRVVLTLTFFLFLMPMAILFKLFSKTDSLQLKSRLNQSYYIERSHIYTKIDLENVW